MRVYPAKGKRDSAREFGHRQNPFGHCLRDLCLPPGPQSPLLYRLGTRNELLEAQQEYRLSKLEKSWLSHDLVILDELGYVPFTRTGAELLFQFCASRYERGSMIITTNLEFDKWTEVFRNESLTAALLDRLTPRAHILLMNGESYRFRESMRRREQEAENVRKPA